MRVAIASDHAGFDLKKSLLKFLRVRGCRVEDLGTHSRKSVDYPDYAEAVGLAIREKRVERAILICGSGVGASIAANKIPGVRAGLCHDTYSAHQGVEHDNMNVLTLGAWVVSEKLSEELVQAFLQAKFSNEPRHIRRLKKIFSLAAKYCEGLSGDERRKAA
jgi:RpiB/LacA/LacB family sugar-phosphate isomerase